MLTTIDLFAGAGGITEGFRQAGFDCLYANDFDEDAVATFRLNHPDTRAEAAAIETVDAERVRAELGLARGELGVVVGGPPCQGFSINAPERFLDDPRNALFRHYVRFVDEFQPKAIVLENVPGMLSFADGMVFRSIVREFERRGYHVTAKVLFAAHYGAPQERWRLLILGSRDGHVAHPPPTHYAVARANFRGGRDMVFKLDDEDRAELAPAVTVADAISDLPRLALGEGGEELPYDAPPRSEFAREMRAGADAVLNHYAARLSPINAERLKHIAPGGSWRDIPFDLLPAGMRRARKSDHTRRYGRLRADGLAGTVMTKCDPHWGAVFLPDQDRALTVREAARFQTFPDRYRFLGSRVAQYRQVGNAVPVYLARAIAGELAAVVGGSLAGADLAAVA